MFFLRLSGSLYYTVSVSIKVIKRRASFSMDVSRPAAAAPAERNTGNSTGAYRPNNKGERGESKNKWVRIATVAAVAVIAILIGAVIALTAFSNNNGVKPESNYVFKNKLQSVFLNNGQVYFGHISKLNNKYLVITDVYYLKATNNAANSSNANDTTLTLVKLGCELHEPYDQIIINRDQVSFWENLQDNGQVAKAVSTFQKQNPQGQKCVDQSSSASTNSTNNTQGTSAPATKR